jgi:hypothetical protein
MLTASVSVDYEVWTVHGASSVVAIAMGEDPLNTT